MDEIKVLQIGGENWKNQYEMKPWIVWRFVDVADPEAAVAELSSMKEDYELLLLDGFDASIPIELLESLADAYRVVYTTAMLPFMAALQSYLDRKLACLLPPEEIEDFLRKLPYRYWKGQYGTKLNPSQIQLREDKTVLSNMDVRMEGNAYLSLEGDFGIQLNPLFTWTFNIRIEKDAPLELWLEYRKEGLVEISLDIREDKEGAPAEFIHSWHFSEQDMEKPVLVLSEETAGFLSLCIQAKGKGTLQIGPLHYRRSRLDAGAFFPGGKIHYDKNRQEFITYFNPMDAKPPLNVYFSGYRTAEGLEGFYMLREMKAPFLLIGDPRLEGGASYLGSPEYEKKILEVIEATLQKLHFTKDQMIISGLSMGTTGAAYYGTMLEPHAIVLGKPIVNEGKLAMCARRIRPDDFLTSLDIVRLQRLVHPEFFEEELSKTSGSTSSLHQAAEILNQKIWERFDETAFLHTEFAIAYMNEDDYDQTGYLDILEHLKNREVRAYGKGITGRHNDNTTAVVNWFKHLYKRILKEDFGRG